MFNKKDIPKKYKEKLDKIFLKQKEGFRKKDKKILDAVLLHLLNLSKEYPDMPMTYYLMATINIELKRKEDAINMFKKTISISQDSEDVSWLFFNFLWTQKMFDEALSEARRYLIRNKHKPNKKYTEIINVITEKLNEKSVDTDLE